MTVLFYPDALRPVSKLYQTMQRLGWVPTNDPLGRFDVALFWWYGKTVYEAGNLPTDFDMINEGGVDVTKTHLHDVHRRVFGYGLEWEGGPAVIKQDAQCIQPRGTRIDESGEPTAPEGWIVERLIDTEDGGDFVDIRVPVFGSHVPYVAHKRRAHRFEQPHSTRIDPAWDWRAVFSADECMLVVAFAHELGVPVTELDILRDKHDGRIYVVDSNNVAGGMRGICPEKARMEAAYDAAFKHFIEGHV